MKPVQKCQGFVGCTFHVQVCFKINHLNTFALFVCVFVCLFGWLVDWPAGWLAGWLAVCLFVCLLVCLFVMVLYIPVTNSSGYFPIFLGSTNTKQRIMRFVQEHNTVPSMSV